METSDAHGGAVSIGEKRKDRNGKYSKLLIYVATVVVTITFCAVFQSVFSKGSDCSSMLRDGYWTSSGQWWSNRCIMHQYQEDEVSECMKKWDQVVTIGDDQARECFKSFSGTSKQVQFLLHPRLSEDVLAGYQHITEEMRGDLSLLVVHQPNAIEHTMTASSFKDELLYLVKAQEKLLRKVRKSRLILALTMEVAKGVVGDEREDLFTVATQIYSNRTSLGITCLYLPPPLSSSSSDSAISQDLNIILNSFCNSPSNATCCVQDKPEFFLAYLATSLIIAVLACYLGFYLIIVSGATFAIAPYLDARGFDSDKFLSVLHVVGTMAAVLLYIQMAGRLEYFSQVELAKKNWLILSVLVLAAIVASFSTITDSEPGEALSVSQCYEWRGWMMLLVVLLHWTGYEKEAVGRAVVDLAVGGFVFLSGYCNFMKFCCTKEMISVKTAMQALVHLNFIPVCVSVVLGTPYGAYYLAPLLSLSYLVTLIFVGAWPALPARSSSEMPHRTRLKFVVKMVAAFVASLALPYIKNTMDVPIVFTQSFDGDSSNLYYWIEKYRFNLLWGIFFGYLKTFVEGKSASLSSPQKSYSSYLRIGAIVSGVLLLLIYLVTTTLFLSANMQSVLGILPILSYLLLRNGFERLQKLHSLFLEEIGTICVWLFVSHRHILMAFNGKGALVLLPRFYYVNLLLVLMSFILISIIISQQLHTIRTLKNAVIKC